MPGSVISSAYISKSPGETKDKDTLVNSGNFVHTASISSIDWKKGFNDPSKAAQWAGPGITQPAILEIVTKSFRNPFSRSLYARWFWSVVVCSFLFSANSAAQDNENAT